MAISRTALIAAGTALHLLGTALAAHAQQLRVRPFVSGLSYPVAFLADPTSPTRHFVVEQQGHIRVVVDGVLQATDFLDLSSVVSTGSERGLLGMAIDPDYAHNRRFYVYYTRQDDPGTTVNELGGLVVSRFTASPSDPTRADPTSRFEFRWGSSVGPSFIAHSEFSNHNGGTLMFGPDGYLYIGTGDGGGSYDSLSNAQRPDRLLGKMLRIDVNVPDADPQGYRVPPDNPFVDGNPISALPEIWDVGLRNPWKYSFDDPAHGGTGALIIADVGQDRWEEIDYEPAGQGGRNYGWRIREGSHPDDVAPPTAAAFQPLTDPVFEYFHSSGLSLVEGRSVTGGHVYRGADLSAFWRGRYFFADFVLGRIWSADIAPGSGALSNIVEHTAAFGIGAVSSFGVDTRGELFMVGYGGANQGVVYRLCEIGVTPGVVSFSSVGGTGTVTVTVTTAHGCGWSVSGGAEWVSVVSNTQGTQDGTVVFRVAPNGGPAGRRASLNIDGASVTISQTGTPPVHGDRDGNGSGDLLWQHADGRVAAWLMRDGTLIDGVPLGIGALMDPDWRIVASGDFDRDGSLDVVFQHQRDGRLAIWLMSGTTQLAGVAITPGQVPDTNWKIRGAADFDRDGWTDLIWQHQATGQVAVWLMTGTQLRDGRLLTPPSVSDLDWRIVGVGDMNGDGNPDLVWQHNTNGLISVWLMNGLSLRDGVLFSPGQVSDTNWKIRAVTDLNGDGKLDLVWQNQTAGFLAVWFMNGTTRIGDGVFLSPSSVADTGWQIVGPR